VEWSSPLWTIGEASAVNRHEIQELAESYGVTVDYRRRNDVIADMRAQHRDDVVPPFQIGSLLETHDARADGVFNSDTLLPIGGVSNSLTVLCNETGQFVTYQSDEHGFRNPRGIWSEDKLDIAVVGQSFPQGYCVPDGKGFVDLLRAEYPATLNLGVSGEGPFLQFGAIREFLPRYAPQAVVWVFQESIDVSDLRQETKHSIPMRYLEDDMFTQDLADRQPEIDRMLAQFASAAETAERQTARATRRTSLVRDSVNILKLRNVRTWLSITRATDDARDVQFLTGARSPQLSDVLRRAQREVNSWGGTLYFVYLPSWNRYKHHARSTESERVAVLQIANALGIPTIDVTPVFQTQNDPLSLFPFRRFGHYNEAGNKLVADAILNTLRHRLPVDALSRRRKDVKDVSSRHD
jgi:hypothetical protein